MQESQPASRHDAGQEIAKVAPKRVGLVGLVMHSVSAGNARETRMQYEPMQEILDQRTDREGQNKRDDNGSQNGRIHVRLLCLEIEATEAPRVDTPRRFEILLGTGGDLPFAL